MTPQRIRMIDARPETLEKVRYRPVTLVRKYPKIQRNDPCPCGSGKKYKKCCGAAAKEAVNDDRND